jgi:hypothetical protein
MCTVCSMEETPVETTAVEDNDQRECNTNLKHNIK